jgi:hypothetical protein
MEGKEEPSIELALHIAETKQHRGNYPEHDCGDGRMGMLKLIGRINIKETAEERE